MKEALRGSFGQKHISLITKSNLNIIKLNAYHTCIISCINYNPAVYIAGGNSIFTMLSILYGLMKRLDVYICVASPESITVQHSSWIGLKLSRTYFHGSFCQRFQASPKEPVNSVITCCLGVETVEVYTMTAHVPPTTTLIRTAIEIDFRIIVSVVRRELRSVVIFQRIASSTSDRKFPVNI